MPSYSGDGLVTLMMAAYRGNGSYSSLVRPFSVHPGNGSARWQLAWV